MVLEISQDLIRDLVRITVLIKHVRRVHGALSDYVATLVPNPENDGNTSEQRCLSHEDACSGSGMTRGKSCEYGTTGVLCRKVERVRKITSGALLTHEDQQ